MTIIIVIYGIIIFFLIGMMLCDYFISKVKDDGYTKEDCIENISYYQQKLDVMAMKCESCEKIDETDLDGYLEMLEMWKRRLRKIQKKEKKK